jgi:monomeric sarcosine oxidase
MSGRKHYDVAVIGLGTMGSFTAVEFAKRGLSVVGIDQFTPPHGRGSHSGGTRIYRLAYPEGSGYVPLSQLAGPMWDQAGEQMGTKLLHRSGVLYMGPPEEAFLSEVAESASTHHLQVESLTADEVHRRYPAFEIPENYVGLLDVHAGWLDVDASITGSLTLAQSLGVECIFDQPVKAWDANETEVHVHLEKETISAGRLVITAGAWAGALLRDLQLSLAVKRKVVAWFDPLRPELFEAGRVPVFSFADNFLYGFPYVTGLGVRLAEHFGGSYLADADSPVPPPGSADLDSMATAAAKYIPGLAGSYHQARSRITRSAVCLYTMTPDEDFIVDRHPNYSHVVFAAGFSGHGFKFAPVIAVALADLALAGKTELPIGFLSLDRPTCCSSESE